MASKEDALLDKIHHEKLVEFVPVIVCLSLLSVAGIVGNVFTIGFYGFHTRLTPTVFMITWLAVVDMSVCVILIHAIIEIGINVLYTNRVTCKIFHFLIHWAIAASALILMFISIDRFRRICRPLKKQIEIPVAKRIVVIVIAVAFLLSIRDFVNFDIIEFPLRSSDYDNSTVVMGHFCTTTDKASLKVSVNVFLGVDALLVITVMVTLVITYANVVWTICKTGSREKDKIDSSNGNPAQKTDTEMPPQADNSYVELEESGDGKAEGEALSNNKGGATTERKKKHKGNNADQKKQPSVARFKSNLKQSERRITLLMIIVSVGFFLCFLPYFIIKLGIRSVKRASDLELGAGTQFGIRLVYVNSFLNPLIFCAFNPQFRKYIMGVLAKCKFYSKGEAESSSQATFSLGKEQPSSE